MSDQEVTVTITVEQAEAVEAIKNVRGWWSQQIEGSTDKVGDEFTYRYKDVHSCKIKVIEFVPQKRVEWLVVHNYFNFTKDKREWKGTKMVFDVSRDDNKTENRFTHEGLVPEHGCFNICSKAWGSYINGSLRNLTKTGKGQPNPKEWREGSWPAVSGHSYSRCPPDRSCFGPLGFRLTSRVPPTPNCFFW
jgi:hypothetical protein